MFSSCLRFIKFGVDGFLLYVSIGIWLEEAVIILIERKGTHTRKDERRNEIQEIVKRGIPIYSIPFENLIVYSLKVLNIDYAY